MKAPTERRKYVVGFLFSEDRQWVALIRKTKPEWQAGKLNGIGGKIEWGESHFTAMGREFKEETGLGGVTWRHFAEMHNSEVSVYCFTGIAGGRPMLKRTTDEKPDWFIVDGVTQRTDLIPNLRWLIPLALDQESKFATVVL